MVPALINEHYVIRFAICTERACDKDITYAWDVIGEMTSELLLNRRDSNRQLEKAVVEESPSDEEDEVFPEFDNEMIFDNQRCNLQRARLRRNLFLKMVSDPKSYHHHVFKSLDIDNMRIRSQSLGETDPKCTQSTDYIFGTPL